ncbi:MAG: hypothetical protein H6825_03130 [Planctomycetes bacterium]|nr:hypothetical protein [Planctomycetota bacterium]
MPLSDENDQLEQNRAKYRELAEHAREMLFQQQARFSRVDEKAAMQLSATTVLLGAATFFGGWAADDLLPPHSPLAWLTIALGVACAGAVIGALWHLLAVIKHHIIPFIPLTDEYLQFVQAQSRTNVNYHLAKISTKAHGLLVEQTHAKAKLLARAYQLNKLGVALLIPLVICYCGYRWQRIDPQKHLEANNGDLAMTDESKTPTPSDDSIDKTPQESRAPAPQGARPPADTGIPDTSIQGPDVVYLTESYDPDTIESRRNPQPEPEAGSNPDGDGGK